MKIETSPNMNIKPVTAKTVNNHLFVGDCDTVELAQEFGTPLWVMDEKNNCSSGGSF